VELDGVLVDLPEFPARAGEGFLPDALPRIEERLKKKE